MRTKHQIHLIWLVVFFSTASLASAAELLVPTDYPTIQEAITAAEAGDIVKVAAGTYNEHLVMKEGVTLEGGYASDFSSKDIAAQVTVIDGGGEAGQPVVLFDHIETGALDGFTITGGDYLYGGGIDCEYSRPTISNNIITGNTGEFGGGILCYFSSPTITDNVIKDNEAANSGGGIYCESSDPGISDNEISGNRAGGGGGGIFCSQAEPRIENNTIRGNRSGNSMYYGLGGGIGIVSSEQPIIAGNTISGNESTDYGGGIYSESANPRISGNGISDNRAGFLGGGIYCESGSPAVTDNLISGNESAYGGGTFCYLASLTLTDNVIKSNEAANWGGGIYCEFADPEISGNEISDNRAGEEGGGIFVNRAEPQITNNTISHNRSGVTDGEGQGGGILLVSSERPVIADNTIAGNSSAGSGGGIASLSSHPVIAGNSITDNTTDMYGGGIYCFRASPTIRSNLISGNSSDFAEGGLGGGIACRDGSSPLISANTIHANRSSKWGGGIGVVDASAPAITNNILSGNEASFGGAVIFMDTSGPEVTNNTIVGNLGKSAGGGIYLRTAAAAITNTIFRENVDDLVFDFDSKPAVSYSDLTDPRFSGKDGNISKDPLFVDPAAGDYRLTAGSPCLDTGDPGRLDPGGSRSDMGAFGGPGAAWGDDIPLLPLPPRQDGTWQDLGLYGGQMSSLAIDPEEPLTVFAASYLGDGLFVSRDGGASWQTVDGFRNQESRQITIDKTNHARLWAASSYFVYLSEDGGSTWAKWRVPEDRHADAVAIDPADSETVYVGAAGAADGPGGRVYKTIDNGDTWEELTGFAPEKTVTFLAINPGRPAELWALTGYNEAGRLYKSPDRGATWQMIDLGLPDSRLHRLAIDPQNPDWLLVSGSFGVLSSTDGGATWQQPTEITSACAGLAYDPGNPGVVYAATYLSGSNNFVFKSVDGGVSWEEFPANYNAFKDLTVDPQDGNILLGADNRLGVYRSSDGGRTWAESNQGIRANLVYDSAFDPNDGSILLAGTIGGLFMAGNSQSRPWVRLSYETTFSVAFAAGKRGIIYAGQPAAVIRSADYGKTWEKTELASGTQIWSLAVSPADSDLVFAGSGATTLNQGAIYKSSDGGRTFSVKKTCPVPVNAITFAPGDPRVIFAGTGAFFSPGTAGAILKSADGGEHWSVPLQTDEVVVKSIAVDPADPNTVYAGCGNSDDKFAGLLKSSDEGLTWQKEALAGKAVTDLKVLPGQTHILYAATFKNGVLVSLNRGADWVGIGLSDYFMFDLSLNTAALSEPASASGAGPANIISSGTHSGMSTLAAGTIYGRVYAGPCPAGTATLYPSGVSLDMGGAQGLLTIWEDQESPGEFVYAFQSVLFGDGYTLAADYDGFEPATRQGISVWDVVPVAYDFCLEPGGPLPDLKVNGEDGPLTLAAGDPVEITLALDPAGKAGVEAEWWIGLQAWTLAGAPKGLFSLVYPIGWRPTLLPFVQVPIQEVQSLRILSAPLPPGRYRFHFALDPTLDRKLDGTWQDLAEVTVQ